MFKIRPLYRALLNFKAKNVFWNGVKLASTKSSSTVEREDVTDEPIKYSASAAYKHKAETTRRGYAKERLWYEPYVIIVSLSIFMIYFTMLREENDIDEELGRTLYSRIKGLEEHQLKVSLEYNRENGLETKEIINRLAEIQRMKKEGTYQN